MFWRLVALEPDGEVRQWMETGVKGWAIAFGSAYADIRPDDIVMLETVYE